MFLESAVHGFFEALKVKLNEFKYLPNVLWSPSTDYDERLASYVVKIDNTTNKVTNNEWIGLIWSLGTYDISDNNAKPYTLKTTDKIAKLSKTYNHINKKINIEVGVFTPNPYLLVHFVEMFSVVFDRSIEYNCIFPGPLKDLGPILIQPYNLSQGEFTPNLDRETKGSLSKFGFTFDISVPIVRLSSQRKIIGSFLDPLTNTQRADIRLNENIPPLYVDQNYPGFTVI